MKYNVLVEETLSRIVTVEAESPEEAEHAVFEMYRNEEIVLDDGDLCGQVEITAYEVRQNGDLCGQVEITAHDE